MTGTASPELSYERELARQLGALRRIALELDVSDMYEAEAYRYCVGYRRRYRHAMRRGGRRNMDVALYSVRASAAVALRFAREAAVRSAFERPIG